MTDHQEGLEAFTEHRPLLFTLAYEITGSVADAEDVVQESYLRWANVDVSTVQHPRAYLVQIATRQALNRLRTLARRQEDYVGPWLPEPLVTAPDVADDVVLAESISMAMMLVLQTLSPEERAVFLLREVFGYGYDEIASAVGKSVPTTRQIAHRAKAHVQARRPRFEGSETQRTEVAKRFMTAAATGDLQALMDVLAPDAVLLSDSGGKVQAPRRAVHTAEKVARLLIGLGQRAASWGVPSVAVSLVNGMPGAVFRLDGVLDTVMSIETDGERVTHIYLVRNPDKLVALGERILAR